MFEAAAKVENEGIWIVFLQIRKNEISKKAFPRAGTPEDHGMRRVLAMQIEVIGSAVIRFKDGQVLLFQVVVPLVAGMKSEKQREVGIVGIQDEQRTKIEGIVAGYRREVGIEQVIFLFVELCVVH